MIFAHEGSVSIDGQGIALLSELTAILSSFRHEVGFPDDMIDMVVEVSKKSDKELHDEAEAARKGDSSAIEAMIHKLFGDKESDADKKPRTDEKKKEELHGENK